jgi:hypothetical protein
VLIVDDLLATSGTAAAVAELVEKLGGARGCLRFRRGLDFLDGRKLLSATMSGRSCTTTNDACSAPGRLRALAKINASLKVLHKRPGRFP